MLKRLFVYLLLFLSNLSSLFATDKHLLDSMKIMTNSSDPLVKLNALYILSFEYGFIEPRKGIEYGKQCLELATRINHRGFQVNAYNGMGNCYETLANFDSARWCHQQSYEIAKKQKSKGHLASAIFNIGNCYREQGNYRDALSYYLEAYKLVENGEYNPRADYQLGEILLKLGKTEDAEYYTRKGIPRCEGRDIDYICCLLYINLAKCHAANGKTDSALIVLNKAIPVLKQNTDQLSICVALNALGEVFVQRDEIKKALPVFLEELAIQQQINNKNGICITGLNIAYCYSNIPGSGKSFINQYISLVEQNLPAIVHNKNTLANTYQKLSSIYEASNDYEKAHDSYKKFTQLNDSLLNIEKFYQIQELQTRYDTEKKEKLIGKQNMDLEKQKSLIEKNRFQLISIIALLISVVLFSLIFYIRFRARQKIKLLLEIQKQEKIREQALQEKETEERSRIAKDIHDELGSGVSKIFLLTEYSIQMAGENTGLKENLKTISKTAGTLAENMRDLVWTLNPENSSLDNLVARINEYCNEFLEELPVEKTSKIDFEIPPVKISQQAQRNIFLTFKEALNNAIKHSGCTHISVSIFNENSLLTILIKDNGSGFEKDKLAKSGNGLRNMENRINDIKGTFLISSSQKGTCITIKFPYVNLE